MLGHRSDLLGGKVGPELFCIFKADAWLVQQGNVLKLARQKYWPYLSCYKLAVFQGFGPACSCSSWKNNVNKAFNICTFRGILHQLQMNSNGDLPRADSTEVTTFNCIKYDSTLATKLSCHVSVSAVFLGVRFTVKSQACFHEVSLFQVSRYTAHRAWRSGFICLTAYPFMYVNHT